MKENKNIALTILTGLPDRRLFALEGLGDESTERGRFERPDMSGGTFERTVMPARSAVEFVEETKAHYSSVLTFRMFIKSREVETMEAFCDAITHDDFSNGALVMHNGDTEVSVVYGLRKIVTHTGHGRTWVQTMEKLVSDIRHQVLTGEIIKPMIIKKI